MDDKEPKRVHFSDIASQGHFRMQPEGFLMQKVSAIHFLPVQAGCKYRAFLMDQGEKVYIAKR